MSPSEEVFFSVLYVFHPSEGTACEADHTDSLPGKGSTKRDFSKLLHGPRFSLVGWLQSLLQSVLIIVIALIMFCILLSRVKFMLFIDGIDPSVVYSVQMNRNGNLPGWRKKSTV